jgi:hypothetical protein
VTVAAAINNVRTTMSFFIPIPSTLDAAGRAAFPKCYVAFKLRHHRFFSKT